MITNEILFNRLKNSAKMSQRHRLDNKYTAPKKGSLQDKIKLAEESITNEANSQRFRVTS